MIDRFTAEGAIVKRRFVKFGSSDSKVVQASAVTDRIIGVYSGGADAADTEEIEVCLLGICFLEVSGAIGRGMSLTTDADGKGVNAAPAAGVNNRIAAVAMQSGTNAVIRVFVVQGGWMQGA
jgi:hypothetical protein